MFKIFNINLKPESALLASSLLTVHFVVSAQSNTTTIPATVAISGQDTAVNGLVLNGVSIVDTFTGRVTSHMTIVMVGGTITEIAPEGSLPVRGDLQNVDARGKYVVPSFNDMHVHVLEQPFPSDVYKLLLASGVTGWRQMSGSPQLLQARQAGTLGLGNDTPELLAMPGDLLLGPNANTPAIASAEVLTQQAQGADFIKTIDMTPDAFYASLATAKQVGLSYVGHLSPGVDPARASANGMRSIEHLGPTEYELMASSPIGKQMIAQYAAKPPAITIPPGTTGSEPILIDIELDPTFLTDTQTLINAFDPAMFRALARTFAANQTYQTPTLIKLAVSQYPNNPIFTQSPKLRYEPAAVRAGFAASALRFSEEIPASGMETLKKEGSLQLEMVRMLDEEGVPLLTGSDSGIWEVPGFSLHQEFALLAAAGLSPLRILQMTTLYPAQFLHRETTMGSVTKGKAANLVLLDADPTKSVVNLDRIDAVVRAGNYFSKADLEAMKQEVAAHMVAIGDEPVNTGGNNVP